MSNTLHVIAAAQQAHEAAKYIPMTAKDSQTAKEAGIFAGVVVGAIAIGQLFRGGSRSPATGRR